MDRSSSLILITVTTTFSYRQSLFHVPLSPCTYSPSPAFLLLPCKQAGLSPLLNTRSRCSRAVLWHTSWPPGPGCLASLNPSCFPCQFPPLPFPTSNNSCSSHSKSSTVALSRLCSLVHWFSQFWILNVLSR